MSASECYVTMEARLGSNLRYLADNLTLQNPPNGVERPATQQNIKVSPPPNHNSTTAE